MSTLAVLKTDGNCRNLVKINNKNKPDKLGAPKIRLRLNEAHENHEKANRSEAKYNFDPSKDLLNISTLSNKDLKYTNYELDKKVNRNKISQMHRIIFPDKNDPYDAERPGPRCLGNESYEYLTRNCRSSIMMKHNLEGPVPPDEVFSIRCPSNEAVENLDKGRGSRMMNVLQHSNNHREIQPSPRIRHDDAAEIYKKNQSGSMANLLNPTREVRSAVNREPRCPTSESRETWERSLGHSMSSIMGARPHPESSSSQVSSKKKVTDEDGNEIDPLDSTGMSYVLKHNRDSYSNPLTQQRVKFEGEEIALKHRGTLTNEIKNYNKNVLDAPMAPRIRPEAQETADMSRGNATKNLMIKFINSFEHRSRRYGKLPGDSKPIAHINRYSRKIARQSQGGAMRDALCPPRQIHSKHRARSAYR